MAANSGFGLLGRTLAGGNGPSEMMAEAQGEQLGANTQNVMAQAAERRSKIQAGQLLENEDPATMQAMGLQPGEGKQAALELRAGGNPQEFAAAHKTNVETRSRQEIADPNTTDARRQQLLASFGNQPFKPYESVGANTYAKTMDPNAAPVTDQMGHAMIGNYNAEAALKTAQAANPSAFRAGPTVLTDDQAKNYVTAQGKGFTPPSPRQDPQGKIAAAMAAAGPDDLPASVSAQAQKSWFGNGANAKNLTSVNMISQHLSLAEQLAAQLKNGSFQPGNVLAQKWSQMTGNAAPTNLSAVNDFLGPEVVKFLNANGGTGDERKELTHAMALGNSPAQFQGTADTIRNLLGGRVDALRLQHGADFQGRGNFETRLLPEAAKYFGKTQGAPAAGANPALDAALAKYGAQ
jgi:hypothetical protein